MRTSFHTAIKLEKELSQKELARSLLETENSIIQKDLNSHELNSAVKSPQYFCESPKITSTAKLAEVQNILPNNLKFSGSSMDTMSIAEYLNILTSVQDLMQLTEPEFIDRMLACSRGLAHELIYEWKTNGENVSTIYHNLIINFDKRLSPHYAKSQLYAYKVPKAITLAKAESQIMSLASRTASVLPEGPSRTAIYNLEAYNAIIRALPAHSSSTVHNLYNQISARLGRTATFAELSRVLNLYRSTIDQDIKQNGGDNTFKFKKDHHYYY